MPTGSPTAEADPEPAVVAFVGGPNVSLPSTTENTHPASSANRLRHTQSLTLSCVVCAITVGGPLIEETLMPARCATFCTMSDVDMSTYAATRRPRKRRCEVS